MSTTTKVFALTHPTGGLLPKFTPGSHIVVHMRDGGKVFRNSYSLINGGYNQSLGYFIGVQLAQNSKGGSKYLHEKVARGGELTISVPANCFPSAESAVKHLLIAGGIGITPLLAHRTHLKLNEQRVELHYTFRNAESAAFVPFLGFQNDPNVHLYDDSLGQKLDIPALIRRQPEGTHLYTCGPPGLMDAAINAAEALGWPPELIHVERFGAETHKGDEPFDAVCQNAGKTIKVGATEHLLDCLEHAGIEVPFGCRAGSCGTCEVGVLSGKIIHRDFGSLCRRAGGRQEDAGLRLARGGPLDPEPLMALGRVVPPAGAPSASLAVARRKGGMTDAKPGLKAKALHEFRRFATMFAYLWVMFFLLQLHQYVILAQRHIPFEQYGVGLINALVLAKVMLVADDLRLGEWRGRRRRPLIYPVLLRSTLFAVVFIVFDIIEKMVVGVLHGKAVADSIETFGGGGILGAILVAIIVAIALIPFFGFVEVSRLMDPGELAQHLLPPRSQIR